MSDTMAFVDFEPLSVPELFISVLIEGAVALEPADSGSASVMSNKKASIR